MNNQNDISRLTSEDLEMLLLGTVAFWGDGSLNKEELDLLNQSCKKRIENLEIASLSDSSDKELSCKEYIIALFKMIEKVSSDTKIYEDTELHKDFIKKKGKNYQPDDQLKFFSMLINELQVSYEDDRGRFLELKNEMRKIVVIDKTTDREKDMISLLECYIWAGKIRPEIKGCLFWVIVLIGIAWYFFK